MMTFCFWCPTCGWLESKDDHAATCKHRPFGFCRFPAKWRDDRGDLAMALELACFLEFEWHVSGKSDGNKSVADWLRAKTMIALRGER